MTKLAKPTKQECLDKLKDMQSGLIDIISYVESSDDVIDFSFYDSSIAIKNTMKEMFKNDYAKVYGLGNNVMIDTRLNIKIDLRVNP